MGKQQGKGHAAPDAGAGKGTGKAVSDSFVLGYGSGG